MGDAVAYSQYMSAAYQDAVAGQAAAATQQAAAAAWAAVVAQGAANSTSTDPNVASCFVDAVPSSFLVINDSSINPSIDPALGGGSVGVQYQVLDNNGAALAVSGLVITEDAWGELSGPMGGIGTPLVNQIIATTDLNGQFTDPIGATYPTGLPFTYDLAQALFVSGNPNPVGGVVYNMTGTAGGSYTLTGTNGVQATWTQPSIPFPITF